MAATRTGTIFPPSLRLHFYERVIKLLYTVGMHTLPPSILALSGSARLVGLRVSSKFELQRIEGQAGVTVGARGCS
ncbi:hypothetical protein D5086_022444 [Populus alba]|uniref:Uncharacterized protein n=1 Tax=Populus alba TaxID=43335 RepID=A0ACC4BFZ3_POPAL